MIEVKLADRVKKDGTVVVGESRQFDNGEKAAGWFDMKRPGIIERDIKWNQERENNGR